MYVNHTQSDRSHNLNQSQHLCIMVERIPRKKFPKCLQALLTVIPHPPHHLRAPAYSPGRTRDIPIFHIVPEGDIQDLTPEERSDNFKVLTSYISGGDYLKCPECHLCRKKPILLRHFNSVHLDVGSVNCLRCERRFQTSVALGAHMRVHQNEEYQRKLRKKAKAEKKERRSIKGKCSMCGRSPPKRSHPSKRRKLIDSAAEMAMPGKSHKTHQPSIHFSIIHPFYS